MLISYYLAGYADVYSSRVVYFWDERGPGDIFITQVSRG